MTIPQLKYDNEAVAEKARQSLMRLDNYVVDQDFKGYDPYDLLAANAPVRFLGPTISYVLTQLNKRDPFQILRTLLFVPKQYVPKGLALFIESYSKWAELGLELPNSRLQDLNTSLDELRSPGYDDKWCWGLNYAYATKLKYVPSRFPSLVVTAYAHRAMESLYETSKDPRILEQMESSVRFLLEDLPRTNEGGLICFSYYTIQKDVVFNANAKGAEMLARMFRLTGKEEYRELAIRSMDHVIKYQKEDGRWNYRISPDGTEREQIDFHQSDILESLHRFTKDLGISDGRYIESLDKGIDFYLKVQFKEDGTCHYRWPRYYPIDIHNQGSGILTFARLSERRPELLKVACKIAEYTIENMQLSNGGFAYRKHKMLTDRTSYIRWANAWMHLALTSLLVKLGD